MTSKLNPKDIKQLEDAPNQSQYQIKPIQNYGMSLIQNMGYTKERGIGFNQKNALKQPLVLKPRAKGLGLGAKPQQANEQDKQEYQNGDSVQITADTHKGMVGRVIKFDIKQKTVTVQLAISSVCINLKQKDIKKITMKEFEQLIKRVKQAQKQKQDPESSHKKRLKWVWPGIRCKVISKTSQYYLKKIVVSEILSDRQFECIYINQKDQRQYIRNLRQKDLQTIIPKPGNDVIIVGKKNQNKGKLAKVLERNKGKGEVVVQTKQNLEVLTLQDDQLSQFAQI